VEQYFKEDKKTPLRYPNLPLLVVVKPDKKVIHLPPEFCTVLPNQVVMKKLDSMQTTKMIREAATKPAIRKEKIMEKRQNVNFNKDPCIKKFGASVGKEFEKTNARILDPPTLMYKDKQVTPRNGVWEATEFLTTNPLQRWAILNLSRVAEAGINYLASTIKEVACKIGMTSIGAPRIEGIGNNRDLRGLESKLREYKQGGCQLVFVVVPEGDTYGNVKKIAEKKNGATGIGILTQCIKERTVNRLDHMIVKNLLQKVNGKLNGTNHSLIVQGEFRKGIRKLLDGVMLMGADVTHPSPDQKTIPSIAAVTASHDVRSFQYNMTWTMQSPKQEIIQNMVHIVATQIQYYKDNNQGREPTSIIMYRDGVGEGMFAEVLLAELTAIKNACNLVLNKELPVTFLVVQKRHHTRFFPNPRDADKNGNALPGTVVDTKITHPKQTNFYLVSHASPQGTARPTKYHKLWDDNNIDEDDLQELTYYLCHMFSRCTRSVNLPTPTYYAHLAAFRARVYIEGLKIDLCNLDREMQKHELHSFVSNSPMFFI